MTKAKEKPLPAAKSAGDQDGHGKSERKQQDLSPKLIMTITISLLLAVQSALAMHSYSGHGDSPKFGDFEAQRHWMEITYHLAPEQWYVNSTQNDLNYWGLDYPPLTAYHSWLLGAVAHRINKSWVALGTSRGHESKEHKFFMRYSVIATYATLYAAALYWTLGFGEKRKTSRKDQTHYVFALLYPGLLLIDCAHFQYNHIAFSLFLLAVECFGRRNDEDGRPSSAGGVIGSALFVAALNFKQMELYHALPIFVYLLVGTLRQSLPRTLMSLGQLALMVWSTFSVLWLPFLVAGPDACIAVLTRLFPVGRGIYEDKVASVWCAFSPVLRIKERLSQQDQLRLATGCVLAASALPLLVLALRPTAKQLRRALTTVALAFFLFAYHVHEKSLLLAAVPAILLLDEHTLAVSILLNVSSFSLFPLCVKDGNSLLLALPIFYYVCSAAVLVDLRDSWIKWTLYHSINLTHVAVCLAELAVKAPERYPYLWPQANATFTCLILLGLLAYFTVEMIRDREDGKKETTKKKTE